MERWVEVLGFEGAYEVSDLGRVRGLPRSVAGRLGNYRIQRGMMLKPSVVRGYLHVTLRLDGIIAQKQVHRLVALAFCPNPHAKPQVNHLNGVKADSRAANLEWATPSENGLHAYRTGLACAKGERSSGAVLTELQVLSIRARLDRGEKCVSIANDYPVTDRAISRIKRRVVWSHI